MIRDTKMATISRVKEQHPIPKAPGFPHHLRHTQNEQLQTIARAPARIAIRAKKPAKLVKIASNPKSL